MKSFRTEYEDTVTADKVLVANDIIELGQKIAAFKEGTIPEDKFRALRLARGVYGQRQLGVQMIRIKLPYGKVTLNQLLRIADVSDEFSTGRLHITTRQDIQIHHVSLDETPRLWAELEKDDVTLREACGNTVRNVTASDKAGIDPNELFDVSPYAELVYRYFLRKPFGQELGRKIKIAFSATDEDDALTFMHDFGFIPRIENGQRGFKVLIGGGLGAQPILAQVAFEFLSTREMIPFVEASIRVFDRHGERNSRNKARLKYLIAKIGHEAFLELVEAERKAVQFEISDFEIEEIERHNDEKSSTLNATELSKYIDKQTDEAYVNWLNSNVFSQKQSGLYAAYAKIKIGDFYTDQARRISALMLDLNLAELRFTIDQNLQFRHVSLAKLKQLYDVLFDIKLADSGYNSLGDITACPGTDTCNLGISNSTQTAKQLESLIEAEYPKFLKNNQLKMKISGCMNSCGQHGIAQIGFHGSSIKVKADSNTELSGTLPALQVVLGGGSLGEGFGSIAEKIIKVPSKRVLNVIRYILNDFILNQEEDETFIRYFKRKEAAYFYNLLKPLADLSELTKADFVDWGNEEKFETAIGVGECAGVMIDLVTTLYFDAEEKIAFANEAFETKRYADAVYFAYSAAIFAAKAKLIQNNIRCNTQKGIIDDFETHFSNQLRSQSGESFTTILMQINAQKATAVFAENYLKQLIQIVEQIKKIE